MNSSNNSSESIIRDIKKKTKKRYSSEEKISIILEGLHGEMLAGIYQYS